MDFKPPWVERLGHLTQLPLGSAERELPRDQQHADRGRLAVHSPLRRGKTWLTPLNQPSNSTGDNPAVSTSRGSSNHGSFRTARPGTQVVAVTTPAAVSHPGNSGKYTPLG